MSFRLGTVKLDKSVGPIRRALQYAFYDWASEMPRSKRIITYVGIALQGYAFYFTLMWASMLPKWLYSYFLVLPRGPVSYVLVFLFFYTGRWIQNAMLTSEFVRKTQLETDQIAARAGERSVEGAAGNAAVPPTRVSKGCGGVAAGNHSVQLDAHVARQLAAPRPGFQRRIPESTKYAPTHNSKFQKVPSLHTDSLAPRTPPPVSLRSILKSIY